MCRWTGQDKMCASLFFCVNGQGLMDNDSFSNSTCPCFKGAAQACLARSQTMGNTNVNLKRCSKNGCPLGGLVKQSTLPLGVGVSIAICIERAICASGDIGGQRGNCVVCAARNRTLVPAKPRATTCHARVTWDAHHDSRHGTQSTFLLGC